MTQAEAIMRAAEFIEEGLSMLVLAPGVPDSIVKPVRLGLALIHAIRDSEPDKDVDLKKFEITQEFEDKLRQHGVTSEEIEEALRN